VLDPLFTDSVEPCPQAILDLVVSRARDGHPTGLAYAFQTRRDVDTIAIDSAVRPFYDFTYVDTDAKAHPAGFGQRLVAFCQQALDLKRRTHSPSCSLEYSEHNVARHVHDAPAMSLDLFPEDSSVRFEHGHGGFVVVLH